MKELTRTKVDEFSIEKSITIEELQRTSCEVKNKIISIEELFQDKEKIVLNTKREDLFLNGVLLTFEMSNGIYRIYSNEHFIGIGIIKNNLLKRDIIL